MFTTEPAVGSLVFFYPNENEGEHVGLVVEQKPRTKAFVVAWESSAFCFRAATVERVRPTTWKTEAAGPRAARKFARLATARTSTCGDRLRAAIKAAVQADGATS